MGNAKRPLAALLAAFLLPATFAPVRAQGIRTVVVPGEGGVVVAPRSAPPRMVARPAAPRSPERPETVVLPATGTGLAAPGLSFLPLLGGALLGAAGLAGGGGGSSGPARTR